MNRREFNKTLGHMIKNRRKTAKVTQAELSSFLGFLQPAWSRIESGKQELSVYHYFKLQEFFAKKRKWDFPTRKEA